MIALLRAVSGLIVWAVAFSALYGLQGLGCALGWDAIMVGPLQLGRAALIALWLGFLALHSWMIWHFAVQDPVGTFLSRMAVAIAIIGWVATIYTGVPVVITSMCV